MLILARKRSAQPTAEGGRKAAWLILSSIIAATAGLVPMLAGLTGGDRGSGGGGGSDGEANFWPSATAGFYAPNAGRVWQPLREGWIFQTGDDAAWSDPRCDDHAWSSIEVDCRWEDAGFPDYDGLAWYRLHFAAPATLPEGSLFLRLGRIDDADEVWVNGVKIGSTGELREGGRSAWSHERIYVLPRAVLQPGADNVIAVRVYDGQQTGGMMDGWPAILVQDLPEPLVNLEGTWQLSRSDDARYAAAVVDESTFDPVRVPGTWEPQGRPGVDGDLWYRVHFTLAPRPGEDLQLLLGVIDDEDEVYLNGKLIGETKAVDEADPVWERERVYSIRGDDLQTGENANVLAVKVHDQRGPGGFMRGPVGIMTTADHQEWTAGRASAAGAWRRTWDWLLGRG